MNDTSLLGHLPPQNIEMEESLLASIFIDPSLYDEIRSICGPYHLYKTAHQKIMKAMANVIMMGDNLDMVTVTQDLKESGDLEAVGGAVYIARLIDSIPIAANAPQYARRLKELATLRELIELGGRLQRASMNGQFEASKLIASTMQQLTQISAMGASKGLVHVKEAIEPYIDKLEDRVNQGGALSGITTGLYLLDSYLSGLQPTDLIVVGARPSMGKTALGLQFAMAAAEAGYPTGVFSLEMASDQLVGRWASVLSRVNSTKLRDGRLQKDDWSKLLDGLSKLGNTPLYLDDTPMLDYEEVVRRAGEFVLRHKGKMIVIDYLELVTNDNQRENRSLQLGDMTRAFKALAKRCEIPVVLLCQLNRKLEERANKRPMLSDLRFSGSIEQDSDVVVFIYRDEVYNENSPYQGTAELNIAKHRNGPTGVCTVGWHAKTTKFFNRTEQEDPYADDN